MRINQVLTLLHLEQLEKIPLVWNFSFFVSAVKHVSSVAFRHFTEMDDRGSELIHILASNLCRERFQQGSQSEMSQMRQQHHQLVDYRQPGRGYRLDEVTTAMMVELPPVSNSDSSAVVHRNQDSSSTSSSSKFVRSMCRNGDCEFYGTPEFDFFCSKCFSRLTSSQKGNHVDGSTSKKNRGSGGNGYIVAPGSSSANNSEVATSR